MKKLIPGIKIAPRSRFNEESLSLDAMTCLKGILALFVVFHHLSQKRLFQETHTIAVFEFIGFLFVGIFFFTSGYGLYKSFLTKENYLKNFLRHRLLPIIISLIVFAAASALGLFCLKHIGYWTEFGGKPILLNECSCTTGACSFPKGMRACRSS